MKRIPIVTATAIAALLAGQLVPGQQSIAAPGANVPQGLSSRSESSTAFPFTPLIDEMAALQSQRACGSDPTMKELILRQHILELVEIDSLDVDGVLAEIANERARLSDLRASLEGRRDRSVALLNTANLITGTGLGIAVNATQLSDSSARVGDIIGIGSGVASTILTVLANRRQRGPLQPVDSSPNMLAPLFDQPPALHTYYPPVVLSYLNSIPAGEDDKRGTRLDQLIAQWEKAGWLDASNSSNRQKQVHVLTSSLDRQVRVSIDDIAARMAMLNDVSARVSLLKRDLAGMMRAYGAPSAKCNIP